LLFWGSCLSDAGAAPDAREIEMRRMDMEETKRNAHTVAQLQQLSNTDKERKAKVYAFLYGQKRRNKR